MLKYFYNLGFAVFTSNFERLEEKVLWEGKQNMLAKTRKWQSEASCPSFFFKLEYLLKLNDMFEIKII